MTSATCLLASLPEYIYQAIHDGSGWGPWRRLPTQAFATYAPTPVNVNGEVELHTKWYILGLREEALE